MGFGTITPCQWMEVSSWSAFVTRITASSPSRNRSSGPGTVPLIAVAVARLGPAKPPVYPRYLVAVRGVGYRLVSVPAAEPSVPASGG